MYLNVKLTKESWSQYKDHCEGLLKAIRDSNVENFQKRVEKRDLSEYEEVM